MLRAQLKSLGERAVIANKAALEAEKARDELHNQIEHIEEQLHPVKVGDMVLSKGQLCELTAIGEGLCGNEGPSCVLAFRAGTVTQEHKYSTMYVIGKDSARL